MKDQIGKRRGATLEAPMVESHRSTRSSRSKARSGIERLERDYPIDESTGRDFAVRETRRAMLLFSNREQAAPYTGRVECDPEEALVRNEREEAMRGVISWLLQRFKEDRMVRLVIAASAFQEVNFKSNKSLAVACGLTEFQVRSAKERLKYAFKSQGFGSFDDLLLKLAAERQQPSQKNKNEGES